MLEAIMIVTMMSGQVVQTKVPNFTECLKNGSVVDLQKSVKFAACIPRGAEPDASVKIKSFFDGFQNIMKMQADMDKKIYVPKQ